MVVLRRCTTGQTLPPTATDVFDYEALGTVYQDCKSESAAHYQRAAAFRWEEAQPADIRLGGALNSHTHSMHHTLCCGGPA